MSLQLTTCMIIKSRLGYVYCRSRPLQACTSTLTDQLLIPPIL